MGSNYIRLVAVLSVNAVLMYFVTFANVWEVRHLQLNLNRIYMALMMTAPMGIVMMLGMPSMFENRGRNALFLGGFAILFGLTFLFVRQQAGVGNAQFLRSMIPHHSSAILMCERSGVTDLEIRALCDEIVRAQEEEIARMEAILRRL
jgi:uncharacterized protein (DUF305 family)